MSELIVTVRFTGDPSRSDAVLRENPEIAHALERAAQAHNLMRSTRLVGDGTYMDVDEWNDPADREAFLAELRPVLQRWNELAGNTNMVSQTWRPARPEEAF